MEITEKFSRELAGRIIRRAEELRNEQARTLGRLVKVLRRSKGLSREQLVAQAQFSDQRVGEEILYLLEMELMLFEELSVGLLNGLGRGLDIPPCWLALAAGTDIQQIIQNTGLDRTIRTA